MRWSFKQNNPVATKLWLLNFAILFSAIMSVVVCYELNKGAKLHELNYYHVKYNQEFFKNVNDFKLELLNGPEVLKNNIIDIRYQSEGCLTEIGTIEELFLNAIQAHNAKDLCEKDVEIANKTLLSIKQFENNQLNRDGLLQQLDYSVESFRYHSEAFAPNVDKVVNSLFSFILLFLIIKSISVTVVGFYLSREASEDYKKLKATEEELQRVNEALRVSEERFSLAVTGSKAAIWDWNILTGEEYWAPRFKEILKISNEAFIPTYEDFQDRLHPDDKERVLDAVNSHLNDRIPYEIEFRLQQDDDQYVWLDVRGQALWDSQGKPYRMTGSIFDINRRKEAEQEVQNSEERLRLIMNSVNDGVWDWNLESDDQYLSPKFKKMFGYDDHELPNHPSTWQKLIFPEDLAFALDAFEAHVNEGKNYNIPVRYRHKDGSTVWVICRGVAFKDASGNPVRMVGTHTDITPLKQVEAKLEQSNQELRQFASVASHDLQEPLWKIQSYGDLLLEKYREDLPKEGQHYIDRMANATRRMRRLINALLAYSQVSTKGEDFSTVDFSHTIKLVQEDLQHLLAETKGQLIVHDLPKVQGDARQLYQLFQNLIGNALKFHHESRPPVVTISTTPTGNGLVSITVADNGIGIEERFFDRVFEMFERLNSKDKYEGTGIGLAICKRIVERHDGTLQLKSTYGEGSEFVVNLPLS